MTPQPKPPGPRVWTYCPECGSDAYREDRSLGNEHRQCEKCQQEWFTDIDYTDAVQSNLSERQKLEAELREANSKLQRHYEVALSAETRAQQMVLERNNALDFEERTRQQRDSLRDMCEQMAKALQTEAYLSPLAEFALKAYAAFKARGES